MKLYLSLALVALLFNFSIAARVPKNLKSAASENLIVQEPAAETDTDNNAVELDNAPSSPVDNDETGTNTVNLLDTTNTASDVTLVENAPTKTLATVTTHNTAKLVTPLKTAVVTSVQPVSVKTLTPQTVSVFKTQTPTVTKTVHAVPQQVTTYSQVQPQVTTYSQAQPQVTYSQVQPQITTYSQAQPQVTYSQVQPQTKVWTAQQPHQVVYKQVPQQVVYSQPEQTLYNQQPQQSYYSVQQQQPQQSYYSVQPQPVVVLKSKNVQPNYVRKSVIVDQAPALKTTFQVQPVQHYTKTVTTKVANPMVFQLSPARQSFSKQTTLTGSQLSADVSDSLESAKTNVVVQETENY